MEYIITSIAIYVLGTIFVWSSFGDLRQRFRNVCYRLDNLDDDFERVQQKLQSISKSIDENHETIQTKIDTIDDIMIDIYNGTD